MFSAIRSTQFAKALVLTALTLFLISLPGGAQEVSITLAWDANPEPDVAGYRVYKRLDTEEFQGYHVQVEGKTSAEIDELIPGEEYWFAVTAYNVFGLESGFSEPLPYTVPIPSSKEDDADADGLSDWFEATYGEAGQLDPGSDQDRDAIPAIGEFAHGLNPKIFNSAGEGPFVETGVKRFEPSDGPEGDYFYMRFSIDPNVTQVEAEGRPPVLEDHFVVIRTERSINLRDWQSDQTVNVSLAEFYGLAPQFAINAPEVVILRSRNPVSAQHAEFFRLTYKPARP